jgi:hypothetical protein
MASLNDRKRAMGKDRIHEYIPHRPAKSTEEIRFEVKQKIIEVLKNDREYVNCDVITLQFYQFVEQNLDEIVKVIDLAIVRKYPEIQTNIREVTPKQMAATMKMLANLVPYSPVRQQIMGYYRSCVDLTPRVAELLPPGRSI